MTTNHYFPDTSFFIKCPDFNQYLFDLKPYKLVVCKTVMDELDSMKRSNYSAGKEEREKSFNSREASRTIELLQKGNLSLINEGTLEFYKKVSHNPHLTSDEQILYALKKYAAQHRWEGKIVFLSFDRNQRITAREPDSIYTVADPTEWENLQMEERQYLEVLGGAVNKDERVKQAYEEKIDLEFDLAEMKLHGPLDEIEELAFRLDEARCKEKQEVERYLAEQRVIKEEEARQLRLKNLNKYQITLSSFFGKNEIKLPVEDRNFRKIGEVILGKGWRYLDYPGNFSMVQIQGKIRGVSSPSVMISANRLLPREFGRIGFTLAPIRDRLTLRAGQWKIVLDVSVTISPATYPAPPGVPGKYSVFDALTIAVDAFEMTPEEITENIKREKEAQMKNQIILQRKEKERIRAATWKFLRAALLLGSLFMLILGCMYTLVFVSYINSR